jgi:hypothetical protein
MRWGIRVEVITGVCIVMASSQQFPRQPMRPTIFIIVFVSCSLFLSGQEVEFNQAYTTGGAIKFKNNLGCGIGYNVFPTSKSRIGIFIDYSLNNIPYHDNYGSLADLSKTEEDVQPHNQQVALKIACSFNLLKCTKSLLYFGGEIGLSYFFINEKGEQTVTTRQGNVTSGNFSSNYTVSNRFGIGLLIEYELKDIICKRVSACVSMHPGITSYQSFGVMDSNDPIIIGWLNFNVGIKYSFARKR